MPALKLPNAKPRLSSTAIRALIRKHGLKPIAHPLVIVGIRGYYRNSMGAAGRNDRGIYDDALFVDSPNITAAFNANTDPTRIRKGRGAGAGKGMAVQKPGLWMAHKLGVHGGRTSRYPAVVQRLAPVTVMRDGVDGPYEDTGMFGINIHKGGLRTTSSEGCQTVRPAQWDSFYNLVKSEAKRLWGAEWDKRVIPYLLVENVGDIV